MKNSLRVHSKILLFMKNSARLNKILMDRYLNNEQITSA